MADKTRFDPKIFLAATFLPKRLLSRAILGYDSSGWSAIGKNLRKIENFEELKNDKNAIILYNESVRFENRSDKSFNPMKYKEVDRYANIVLYKTNIRY